MGFSVLPALGEVLFPRLCEACGSRLNAGDVALCAVCQSRLPFRACIDTGFDEDVECERLPRRVMAVFTYVHGGMLHKLVAKVKHGGRRDLARSLGRLAAVEAGRAGAFDGVDVIVPVPLDPAKLRRRGYNQAFEMAMGVSQHTGIPVADVLARAGGGDSQKSKRAGERERNVKGAFVIVDASSCAGRHVLIVDDVMTTGATLAECAALLSGCAASVSVLAVARTAVV